MIGCGEVEEAADVVGLCYGRSVITGNTSGSCHTQMPIAPHDTQGNTNSALCRSSVRS